MRFQSLAAQLGDVVCSVPQSAVLAYGSLPESSVCNLNVLERSWGRTLPPAAVQWWAKLVPYKFVP